MRKLSSSVYLVIRYWKFCNPVLSKLKTKLDEFGDQSRRLCKIVQSKLHRNFVSTILQYSLKNSTFAYIKTTTDCGLNGFSKLLIISRA